MKLADWAREQGIHYVTAWRWFRAGTLPVPAEKTPTGMIIVHPSKASSFGDGCVLYARVSSGTKQDLEKQLERLRGFASARGFRVLDEVGEVGSGLNGHRKKLLKLLSSPSVGLIVVEHRDRLARFGAEYIEAALQSSGKKVLVIDETEMEDDLVQDMIDVLTSFCARLYGRRAAKVRAKKALEAASE